MATTYEPIATTTLGSAAASITFNSISSAYTDLRIILVNTSGGNFPYLTFNGDTAANYSVTFMWGNGSDALSTSLTNRNNIQASSDTSSTLPMFRAYDVMSYAGSTYKSVLVNSSVDANGSGQTMATVGLWRSTSAITSLTFTMGGANNFGVGTTATLYGIKAA